MQSQIATWLAEKQQIAADRQSQSNVGGRKRKRKGKKKLDDQNEQAAYLEEVNRNLNL